MDNIPVTYCKKMDSKCPAFFHGKCLRFEPCSNERLISIDILGQLATKILENQAAIMNRLNAIEKQINSR